LFSFCVYERLENIGFALWAKSDAFLKNQIRKIKVVEGTKRICSSRSLVVHILEVSLIIRLLIPKAAFGVDFLILLSPNMKKDFILVMAMRLFNGLIIE